MTEQQWMGVTNPTPMLKFLKGKASDRKLRLFACACCRQVWKSLTLKPVRRALETSEHFADGAVTYQELEGAHQQGCRAFVRTLYRNREKISDESAEKDANVCIKIDRMALAVDLAPAPVAFKNFYRVAQDKFLKAIGPVLLRCVVGNPFRSVALDVPWRTSAVTALAQAAYDDRTLPVGTLQSDRLAILADALEDAGCTDAAILDHLRGPGPHVRGCFVVDLILDKK
jgi:hypothetical protein